MSTISMIVKLSGVVRPLEGMWSNATKILVPLEQRQRTTAAVIFIFLIICQVQS